MKDGYVSYSDLIAVYQKLSVLLLIAKIIAVSRNAKLSMIQEVGNPRKNVLLTRKSKKSFCPFGGMV